MRIARFVPVLATLVVASLLGAAPAQAAVPANDKISGATPVTLGFSEVLDTTDATTDAKDDQLNESCGAPATDASVWYVLEGTGTGVVVDVSSSDYSAGVLVGVGSPGSLETVACGPGAVGLTTEVGTTYYVLAIDDQIDGSGNGGSLSISFNEAPPAPTVKITVRPTGTFDSQTGTAHLRGTYTCTDADFIEVFGEVTQPVGRFAIKGFFGFFESGTCDGERQRWSAEVQPENGQFKGGQAMTVAFAFACGAFECSEGYVEQTVHLRGGHK